MIDSTTSTTRRLMEVYAEFTAEDCDHLDEGRGYIRLLMDILAFAVEHRGNPIAEHIMYLIAGGDE